MDYQKKVHLFLEESDGQAPEPLVPTHRSLADFQVTRVRTQALSRVYVECQGARLLSAVSAGDSLIPLDTVTAFTAAADVFVKVSPQGSDGGAQHLAFTGVDAGGAGSLVGPGAGPPGAPTLAPAVGAGLAAGAYQYAYTFVTASGESLPGPLGAITTGALLPPPATAPSAAPEAFAGGVTPGDALVHDHVRHGERGNDGRALHGHGDDAAAGGGDGRDLGRSSRSRRRAGDQSLLRVPRDICRDRWRGDERRGLRPDGATYRHPRQQPDSIFIGVMSQMRRIGLPGRTSVRSRFIDQPAARAQAP